MAEAQKAENNFWASPGLVLALISLAFHLLINGHYGFFRDELYFIVCGQRPDWGYVDQPPLIPLLAAGSFWLFGKWLLGFRLLPALVMSATVALTAEFTRDLGGGRFAQWLAGLCVLGGGIFLADGLMFSTEMFQALSWLLSGWILLRIAGSGEQRWWIAFGLVVGISLLSKYMIAFYLVALIPGILLTPLRRSFLQPWLYAGAVVALVMVAPNVWWQARHGWPFLEIGAAGTNGKNLALSPLDFFVQQLLLIGPMAAPVWLAGLWRSARMPPAARIFPIAYVILFVIFVLTHGKPYYLAAIYPTLLGFGAVAIEQWLRAKAARAAVLALVALVAAAVSPMAVPVLPPKAYIAYAAALGMGPSTATIERARLGPLPQQFADMFGWPEMAEKIASVYHSLPPGERAKAVFFGQNYGEAAAIDVFGRPLGLPPAISSHNNYYLWGAMGHDGSVMIVIGGDLKQMQDLFASVTQVGETDAPYAMPYENHQPIYVLRGLKEPMAVLWPSLKRYR